MSATGYYGDVVCPKCKQRSSKVTDSRGVAGGSVRRRRECLTCATRFTTYEYSFDASRLARMIREARRLGQLLLDSAHIE